MSDPWSDIAIHNRRTEAWAERLELRLHAVAWIITAIVLAMRLVAGRQDLTSDGASWEAPDADDPVEATSLLIP